jgi:hypothetical protein
LGCSPFARYSIFGSCLKIDRKYTKKSEACQQLFFETSQWPVLRLAKKGESQGSDILYGRPSEAAALHILRSLPDFNLGQRRRAART